MLHWQGDAVMKLLQLDMATPLPKKPWLVKHPITLTGDLTL